MKGKGMGVTILSEAIREIARIEINPEYPAARDWVIFEIRQNGSPQ